jgi:hypothetical protein
MVYGIGALVDRGLVAFERWLTVDTTPVYSRSKISWSMYAVLTSPPSALVVYCVHVSLPDHRNRTTPSDFSIYEVMDRWLDILMGSQCSSVRIDGIQLFDHASPLMLDIRAGEAN